MESTLPQPATAVPVIILAEDNSVNAKLVQMLMKSLGVTVDVAPNGEVLLGELRRGVYDLVLMDISMPMMDGYEATLKIRDGEAGEANRDIPIIAVTALGGGESEQTCRDVGMNGFVTKPVNKDSLVAAIESLG